MNILLYMYTVDLCVGTKCFLIVIQVLVFTVCCVIIYADSVVLKHHHAATCLLEVVELV